QAIQPGVPRRLDAIEVALRLLDLARLEGPRALAHVPRARDEPRPFEHAEVLRHRLAGQLRPLRQARDRLRAAARQAPEEREARLVSERREDRRLLRFAMPH